MIKKCLPSQKGVFEFAKKHGEHQLTWQPRPGVRMAMVIASSDLPHVGFIAAGRSLQEVEARECNNVTMIFFGWLICMDLVLQHAGIRFYLNSQKNFKIAYMKTSLGWIEHFETNLKTQRIDWTIKSSLTNIERKNILSSLKAWQLGETSDGSHLLNASSKYALKIGDAHHVNAVKLFIKEEQKHGNSLGK